MRQHIVAEKSGSHRVAAHQVLAHCGLLSNTALCPPQLYKPTLCSIQARRDMAECKQPDAQQQLSAPAALEQTRSSSSSSDNTRCARSIELTGSSLSSSSAPSSAATSSSSGSSSILSGPLRIHPPAKMPVDATGLTAPTSVIGAARGANANVHIQYSLPPWAVHFDLRDCSGASNSDTCANHPQSSSLSAGQSKSPSSHTSHTSCSSSPVSDCSSGCSSDVESQPGLQGPKASQEVSRRSVLSWFVSLLLAVLTALTLTGSAFAIVLVFRSAMHWDASSSVSRASNVAVLVTLLTPLVPCLLMSLSSYAAREYNKKDVLKAHRAKFAQPAFESIDTLKSQAMRFHARQVAMCQAAGHDYARLAAAWALLLAESAIEAFGITGLLLDALPVLSSLQFVVFLLAVAVLPMLLHTVRICAHMAQASKRGRVSAWASRQQCAAHIVAGTLYLIGSSCHCARSAGACCLLSSYRSSLTLVISLLLVACRCYVIVYVQSTVPWSSTRTRCRGAVLCRRCVSACRGGRRICQVVRPHVVTCSSTKLPAPPPTA